MAIRPIDRIEIPNSKLELLKQDVRDIISQRVPPCEIVDLPYSAKNFRNPFRRAAREVLKEHGVEVDDPFRLFTVRIFVKETPPRFYAEFNVQEFEALLPRQGGEKMTKRKTGVNEGKGYYVLPDFGKMIDRQLLKEVCHPPMCMKCDMKECAYGREYRKRVEQGHDNLLPRPKEDKEK